MKLTAQNLQIKKSLRITALNELLMSIHIQPTSIRMIRKNMLLGSHSQRAARQLKRGNHSLK